MFTTRLYIGLRCAKSIHSYVTTGMELQKVVKFLNEIAPVSLAEGWDNVGLLVEPSSPHMVRNVLLTNDLTASVMEESVKLKVDLIVSYHPPIFRPLKKVTAKSWKERLIVSALENRIAVYSPHTACDAVKDGVNDWLASGIAKMKEIKPIKYSTKPASGGMFYLKHSAKDIFATLPENVKNDVQVVSSTDAGITGFWHGKYNIAEELHKLSVSNDTVILLPNSKQTLFETGAGRICILEQPLSLGTIVSNIKHHLHLSHLRIALGMGKTMSSEISTVALCAGSGSSVLTGCDVDLYLTGEMSHHDVLDATQNGISVILCEHSNSERGYLANMKTALEGCLSANGINMILSQEDKDPITII